MNYKVILLPSAVQDIIEAHEWYEEKTPGLGEKFQSEISKRINIIKQHPDRFPVRKNLTGSARSINIHTLLFIVLTNPEKRLLYPPFSIQNEIPKRNIRKAEQHYQAMLPISGE